MEISRPNTAISGLSIIKSQIFSDHRGMFSRLYCCDELNAILDGRVIKQVNISRTSQKGGLRGLHFQYPPKSEMKFVRCIKGSVWDVVVDLRYKSPTFLQWFGYELSSSQMSMIVVPEGFAHGFQTLEKDTELLYLNTEAYHPKHEDGLRFNDPYININWPLEPRDLSERDKKHKLIDNTFAGVIL